MAEIIALFGVLATSIGVVVTLGVGIFTIDKRARADAAALVQRSEADRAALDQKRQADERTEWWNRTHWAVGQLASRNPTLRKAGLLMLEHLAESELADRYDRRYLNDVTQIYLEGLDDGR